MMMMMTHLCLALMAPASLCSLLPCVHLSLCHCVLCCACCGYLQLSPNTEHSLSFSTQQLSSAPPPAQLQTGGHTRRRGAGSRGSWALRGVLGRVNTCLGLFTGF